MKHEPRYILFRVCLALGALLGMLLLVQALRNYRYVSQRLVEEDLLRQAAKYAIFFGRHAFETNAQEPEEMRRILEEIMSEEEDIAWVRVLNARNEVVAQSGLPVGGPIEEERRRALINDPTARIFEHRDTASGDVLVAAFPFRPRFRQGRRPPSDRPAGESMGRPHEGPRSGAIEIALFASSATPSFGYLRRNLAISVSAALALVASMGVMGLRFNNFIRGKQLEKQLELARAVQQDLLPKGCARYGEVDFAACCEPAWQVGGDFYDVFPAGENRISLLVGDVSGKGIPAALLMGLMHGAIRSTKVADCGEEHAGACARLNQLLCSRTSVEHFATLFWSYYDRLSEELCYVNAGHFPPFAAGRNGDGVLEIRRLEEGGPVMGVIPLAGYQHGVASFRPGDVLVVYSDGVLEAARADGQEYGEERLLAAIRQNCGRGASELCDEIVGQVRAWVGSGELQDDLTLLVVKAGQSGELEAQMG